MNDALSVKVLILTLNTCGSIQPYCTDYKHNDHEILLKKIADSELRNQF